LYYTSASDEHPYQLTNIIFRAAETQPEDGAFDFTARDIIFTGGEWNLSGTCRPTEDDDTKLSMFWFCKHSETYADEYFSGIIDKKLGKIVGTAGSEADVERHSITVFLSQQPAEVLVYWPHPKVLAESKYKSLWKFAQNAILHQVRCKMWSWSYFQGRRDNRKRYLDLTIRRDWYGMPLSGEEHVEIYAITRTMYPADSRYLFSVAVRLGASLSERIHPYVHLYTPMTLNCSSEIRRERSCGCCGRDLERD
jgi:hypothetical protein